MKILIVEDEPRVRALLKRVAKPVTDTIMRVADLELDGVRHRAIRGGMTIELSAKEFALLTLLASREDEVLSRTQIASLVWDINFDSDTNVVDVAIGRLRNKVGTFRYPGPTFSERFNFCG